MKNFIIIIITSALVGLGCYTFYQKSNAVSMESKSNIAVSNEENNNKVETVYSISIGDRQLKAKEVEKVTNLLFVDNTGEMSYVDSGEVRVWTPGLVDQCGVKDCEKCTYSFNFKTNVIGQECVASESKTVTTYSCSFSRLIEERNSKNSSFIITPKENCKINTN